MSVERLLLAVSALLTSLLAGLAITAVGARFADDRLLELCASSLAVELWLATAAGVVALFLRAPLRETLGLSRGALPVRSIALLAIGTLGASHALDGALELSGRAEDGVLGELPRLIEGARGSRLLAALLAIGVLPGIAEELLCRGLLQRGISRRLGPVAGVVLAALFFGALHLEPVHATFAGLLGLYLGVAAWWADSTRAAIACHLLNNVAAVTLAAWLGPTTASPASCLAGGVLALACLWWVGASGEARRARVSPGATAPELQPEGQPDDR
jgi:membrane protease YdiL (CAAX protease family)